MIVFGHDTLHSDISDCRECLGATKNQYYQYIIQISRYHIDSSLCCNIPVYRFIVTALRSYCRHPGRLCARLRSRSHHTVLKFCKCLYLNSHLPQTIHIWNMSAWKGRLRFHKNRRGFMPWGGASGQNLGTHL